VDQVTKEQALEALESMDDYARMEIGVTAQGPYNVLKKFIEQQTAPNAVRRLMLAAEAVDLGRSIHNERKPEDKIEGPVWDELRHASTEVRTLLAS